MRFCTFKIIGLLLFMFAITTNAANTTIGGLITDLQWTDLYLYVYFKADDNSNKVALIGSHSSGEYANGNRTLKRMVSSVWENGRTNHVVFEMDQNNVVNSLRIDARAMKETPDNITGVVEDGGDGIYINYIPWKETFFWAWRGGNGNVSFYPNGTNQSFIHECIFKDTHLENSYGYFLFTIALGYDNWARGVTMLLRPYYLLSWHYGIGGSVVGIKY